jgi:hypothetical protein
VIQQPGRPPSQSRITELPAIAPRTRINNRRDRNSKRIDHRSRKNVKNCEFAGPQRIPRALDLTLGHTYFETSAQASCRPQSGEESTAAHRIPIGRVPMLQSRLVAAASANFRIGSS